MSKTKIYNTDEVDDILNFILEFEDTDFRNVIWCEPDYDPKDHIYYKARKLRDGVRAANRELKCTINRRDANP